MRSFARPSNNKSITTLNCNFISRSLSISHDWKKHLLRNSVPYKIIGGIQFYERKEIKDMLAYLRLIANPFDRVSFFRVINTPARGLGQKFEEQAYTLWNQEPLYTFKDLVTVLALENKGKKAIALKEFNKIFDGLEHNGSAFKTVNTILNRTDYIGYLNTAFDPKEAESKVDNLKELLRGIEHFEEQGKKTIQDFLSEVALMQEKLHETNDEKEFVQLMTMHAAKGLEFDTVAICGLEEGLFPSGRSINDTDSLEEERRLFYVGIHAGKRAPHFNQLALSLYLRTNDRSTIITLLAGSSRTSSKPS